MAAKKSCAYGSNLAFLLTTVSLCHIGLHFLYGSTLTTFTTKTVSFAGFNHTGYHEYRTLLVYVFAPESHSKSVENLNFFLMQCHSSPDTLNVIIFQHKKGGGASTCSVPSLFEIPHMVTVPEPCKNVVFIPHHDDCFDLGTIGWFLSCNFVDLSLFKFFFFLNCSVRGPFVPTYLIGQDWVSIFTDRLVGNVKLVGTAINCGVFTRREEFAFNPHLQSYAVATDFEGLRAIMNSTALHCHHNKIDAVEVGEFGLSRSIFEAGYQISSLLLEQHYITDWSPSSQSAVKYCMQHPGNPVQTGAQRGRLHLHPYELIFVKVKDDTTRRGFLYAGQEAAEYISEILYPSAFKFRSSQIGDWIARAPNFRFKNGKVVLPCYRPDGSNDDATNDQLPCDSIVFPYI